MKEQIQQLIDEGRTEEALALLVLITNGTTIRLQTRYNSRKKQFNMGLIEKSEWLQTQSQINYAILEWTEKLPKPGKYSRILPSGKKDIAVLHTDGNKYYSITDEKVVPIDLGILYLFMEEVYLDEGDIPFKWEE